MPRVRVVLEDVVCAGREYTEDWTGADEFFLRGAITDGDPANTAGVLTRPISINDGETRGFGEGGGTVYDKDIPNDGRILKVVLNAFDEDASHDWNRREETINQITNTVANGLQKIPNPYAAGAGQILPFVVQATGFFVKMDEDDDLGSHLQEYFIGEFPPGEYRQEPWFVGSNFKGDWRYHVHYSIVKH